MEIENENQNNNDWTPEYESLIKDIKKRREEIKRKREERNNPFGSILPMSMKIAAQTIGLDLVAVKPISAPINLTYLDFVYEDPKAKYKKRKKVIEKLLGIENTEDETESHFTLPYGEIDHPDNTNFTFDIKEVDNNSSQVHNHLYKWANLIDNITKDETKKNWLNDYCNMHSSSGFSI